METDRGNPVAYESELYFCVKHLLVHSQLIKPVLPKLSLLGHFPMDRDTSVVVMTVKGNTEFVGSYSTVFPVSIRINGQ